MSRVCMVTGKKPVTGNNVSKYLPNVTILESSPQKRIKLKKELRFIPERPTDSKIIEDSRP